MREGAKYSKMIREEKEEAADGPSYNGGNVWHIIRRVMRLRRLRGGR
jgi:hypothetical protein